MLGKSLAAVVSARSSTAGTRRSVQQQDQWDRNDPKRSSRMWIPCVTYGNWIQSKPSISVCAAKAANKLDSNAEKKRKESKVSDALKFAKKQKIQNISSLVVDGIDHASPEQSHPYGSLLTMAKEPRMQTTLPSNCGTIVHSIAAPTSTNNHIVEDSFENNIKISKKPSLITLVSKSGELGAKDEFLKRSISKDWEVTDLKIQSNNIEKSPIENPLHQVPGSQQTEAFVIRKTKSNVLPEPISNNFHRAQVISTPSSQAVSEIPVVPKPGLEMLAELISSNKFESRNNPIMDHLRNNGALKDTPTAPIDSSSNSKTPTKTNSLANENQQLRQQLKEFQEKNERLETQLKDFQTTNTTLRQELDTFKKDNRRLRQQNNRLRLELGVHPILATEKTRGSSFYSFSHSMKKGTMPSMSSHESKAIDKISRRVSNFE